MDHETKKSPVPRGKAATAAKNKYRDKTYDRIELAVPKGMKKQIQDHVESTSDGSVNAFVKRALIETMERDKMT